MKLLLTSSGITNASLANALKELVGGDIRIAFIPTAANPEPGEKDWLIKNLVECEALGLVDIVDISALDKDQWLSRVEWASVIVVGGGDTAHLISHMHSSGFSEELPGLLKDRVYVGISAGSIATNPTAGATSDRLYTDEEREVPQGLSLVDFHTAPHLNSPHFPKARDEILKEVSKKIDGALYALDDESGIVVDGEEVKVVTEGVWHRYERSNT